MGDVVDYSGFEVEVETQTGDLVPYGEGKVTLPSSFEVMGWKGTVKVKLPADSGSCMELCEYLDAQLKKEPLEIEVFGDLYNLTVREFEIVELVWKHRVGGVATLEVTDCG